MRPNFARSATWPFRRGAGQFISAISTLILIWGVLLGTAAPLFAGGGPEGVFLVVNANSDASKEVANHYARLRDLPASNIFYLDYQGGLELASGKTFRQQILGPVIQGINQRGLAVQIDTIAYSCDFPWQIDLRKDFDEKIKFGGQRRPIASLTGATYLWQFVMSKSPMVVASTSNRYLQGKPNQNLSRCVGLGEFSSQGFRGRYFWKAGGIKANEQEGNIRYFLSTMLGVSTGRGNTVGEVVDCLKRSVYADSNPPQGAFYYMKNGDVRSQTRHACYQQAAKALRSEGAKAIVAEGVVPPKGSQVIGLMTGKASFDAGDLNIAPGAICEHLTSSGGELRLVAYQSPLTDWIRAGASGACGTVTEPYAVQAKFPLPTLPVHYRRGCSLAEAFYQSVASPYQLLIVGDPLCQPWAQRPTIEVEGWPHDGTLSPQEEKRESTNHEEELETVAATEPDGEELQVLLNLRPHVTPTSGSGPTFWELFIDGKLLMRLPSGTPITLHRQKVRPGWHELRCVGANPDSIESQGRLTGAFVIPDEAAKPGEKDPVVIDPKSLVIGFGEMLRVRCEAVSAQHISIYQHARKVAVIEGAEGTAEIPAKLLGRGPVRLHAVSESTGAASAPVWVFVE